MQKLKRIGKEPGKKLYVIESTKSVNACESTVSDYTDEVYSVDYV